MSHGRRVYCALCHLSRETEITGALSTKDQVTAHQNCLLFSAGLWCTDSPESDDLFGFSVEHVEQEVNRGKKLTCSKCKKKGATAGCELKRCKKSYHYPCAIEAEAETIEDEGKGKYGLYCLHHSQQRKQSKSSVNGLASSSTKATTSGEAGSSKVCCLACEKTEGNISLESLSNSIVVLYCDKHASSTYKMNVHNDAAAHSSDSNSSSSAMRLAPKRRLSVSDADEEMEKTPTKRKSRGRRSNISDDSSASDHNEPNTEMAPLSSDLDESANSVQEHEFIRKNTQSPTGATAGNQQESRDGNEDEDQTMVDAESESLLPAEEPQSPPTTSAESAAHLKVTLLTSENKDQGCSPEQRPGYSPAQHTAGPSIPQQGSTGLLPSPDLSKSRSVTGSPPCPPETVCVPTLSSSPLPSPVAHSSQSSIDSVNFWKCCNAAGCTQGIFADFINEMNNISSRIQSNQASQEDYDLALKVIADTGKLAEFVSKQQKDNQQEKRDGNKDEDETRLLDAESENLLATEICEEPRSPPTSAELLSLTSLAHLNVILVKAEDEDQECSPEQKLPVYSPAQHTAGPSIPQQGSTGLLPSPDLSKSCTVTGPPPCTGTATFPGPPETICLPTLSSSPFPSPVAHSSPSSIDSVSFWKCCNAASCTQVIFDDFINEINNISSRIQSNQASQEDYDLAFKLLADSGKLAEFVVKQQKELQRKQKELKKAAATMKVVISALKRT